MRLPLVAAALVLVALAAPAIGSFHETIGIVPDRVFTLVMQGTTFNGLRATEAPLLEAYLGERVRFLTLATEPHSFHLHGHPWPSDGRIVDVFLVEPERPHAFDVPAGGVDRHAGDWMYHCHFDDHMAQGMWGIFRVYPFMTRVEKVQHGLEVALERLGEPVRGASLDVEVDGARVAAHVEEAGGGRYLVHADLPASGALVVTATSPEHGASVARLSLDGSALTPATLEVAHAHAP